MHDLKEINQIQAGRFDAVSTEKSKKTYPTIYQSENNNEEALQGKPMNL